MTATFRMIGAAALSGALLMTPASSGAQAAAEVFTATASAKTAAGAAATAPVTITIDRKMSAGEAEAVIAAFTSGGAPALRKALAASAATGSVQLGSGPVTPTRFTLERTTGAGRLLTIVTDRPLLFLGAGAADAKPKEGYDFAVIDIEVDAKGSGSGTLAPAARLRVNQGALVVDDYGVEGVRLTAVRKTK